MKYLSEKTNKAYESVEELQKAEKDFDSAKEAEDKKKQERADDAKKVEDAHSKALEATKAYEDTLEQFIDKYGSYHHTITEEDEDSDDTHPFGTSLNFLNYLLQL